MANPRPSSVLERLEQVVRARPDHPAVVVEGKHTYTYAQLWSDASYISRCLRSAGIGKDCNSACSSAQIVALALPKSYEYLCGVLGIWMAGAAFLPLDINLPDERILQILKECLDYNGMVMPALARATDQKRLQDLMPQLLFAPTGQPEGKDKSQMHIDTAAPHTMAADTLAPDKMASLAATDLAYVIFTSGSTGQPKGVLVNHAGIVNLLDEQIAAFALDGETRSLFYLSTSFDASVSDFGTALLAGGTLYIESADDLRPGPGLYQLIKKREITYVDIPPSALRLMDPDSLPDCLKSMVIGGEVCPRDVVTAFARRLRLVCVYGPTEATVCTSWTHCQTGWQEPLIGKPIKDTTYLVLDESGVVVKKGQPGELYISGIGLARGYLNRPALDSERFVHIDGERYYRTRDLVLQTEDDNYVFIGRVDRQVKLRGLLIEPEEIEKRLAEHPMIARAAVIKRAMPANPEREILVAFLLARISEDETLEDGAYSRPDATALRALLSTTLPRWMLPQRYQWLAEMPETSSGKVDLSKLATLPLASSSTISDAACDTTVSGSLDTANDSQSHGSTESCATPSAKHHAGTAAPQNHTSETKIRRAIEQVLGYDHIDADDNLFDLGMDSLAVIEFSAALSRLELEVSPHTIFQNPSLTALLKALQKSSGDGDIMTTRALRADVLESAAYKTLQTLAQSKSLQTIEPGLPPQILCTGGCGFLGARLLQHLLQNSQATIYALVRADSAGSAGERLIAAACDTAAQKSTRQALKEGRLIALPGDIKDDYLALDKAKYAELADKLTCIIHLAARVNMVESYKNLKADNVAGTLNLARLALTGRAKAMHYASTLSVFVATDKNTGTVYESDDLSSVQKVWGGYGQTKLIAEVALRELVGKSLPLSIYRLGLITGDTTSGTMSSHDYLSMFVRGLTAAGAVPAEGLTAEAAKLAIDITPVDWAAAAMATLIAKPVISSQIQTFHLANPEPLTLDRLLRLLMAQRSDLKVSPLSSLQGRQQDFDSTAAAAYLSLCRLHPDFATDFASTRVMDLFQATGIEFDCKRAKAALEQSDTTISPTCPKADDRLINLYIEQALGTVPSDRAAIIAPA